MKEELILLLLLCQQVLLFWLLLSRSASCAMSSSSSFTARSVPARQGQGRFIRTNRVTLPTPASTPGCYM